MGQRDLRRLLISGAMTVVRHASRGGENTDPWLAGMLERKPKKGGRGGPRQPDGAKGLGAGHTEGDLQGWRCGLSGRKKGGNQEEREAARRSGQQDERPG